MSGPSQAPSRIPIDTLRPLMRSLAEAPDRRSAASVLRIYREQLYARPSRSALGFSSALVVLGIASAPIALRMGGVTMMGPAVLFAAGGIGVGNWLRVRPLAATDKAELVELGALARTALRRIEEKGVSGHFGLQEEAVEMLQKLVKEDATFRSTAEALLASRKA